MHEQSETVQRPDGKWINVYGRKTPQAGQQLPGTGTYDTVDQAVGEAKKRSEDFGHAHPNATGAAAEALKAKRKPEEE